MKLWLDDIRPMPFDYDVHVKTVRYAIELLKTRLITEISLDNDLGSVSHDDSPTGEGRHVANYIEWAAYKGLLPKLVWHIHTSNPVAQEAMETALKRADIYWRIGA